MGTIHTSLCPDGLVCMLDSFVLFGITVQLLSGVGRDGTSHPMCWSRIARPSSGVKM
jgi:hypothetical protein